MTTIVTIKTSAIGVYWFRKMQKGLAEDSTSLQCPFCLVKSEGLPASSVIAFPLFSLFLVSAWPILAAWRPPSGTCTSGRLPLRNEKLTRKKREMKKQTTSD